MDLRQEQQIQNKRRHTSDTTFLSTYQTHAEINDMTIF